jgi:peptidoglycan/xylan/chitin deacetylase (PgdA/CDA1 family)
MRLDRLLTLRFVHPLRKILLPKEGLCVSILMYHSISDQDNLGCHPYFQTNTKPEIFSRHMQVLADNNCRVISLSEALSLIGGVPNPEARIPKSSDHRYVVITFDDGFRDFHDNAWPILKKHGFTATMFLPTGFISNERKRLSGRDCLTWSEVVTLAGAGATFGSHTVSHIQLYAIDRNVIQGELRESRRAIEDKLGRAIGYYSYAYAFPEHDEKFVSIYEMSLREAGYLGALTTRIGTVKHGNSPYCLKRLPVNSYDDVELLRAKLEGGYDWLNRIQVMKKKIRFAG